MLELEKIAKCKEILKEERVERREKETDEENEFKNEFKRENLNENRWVFCNHEYFIEEGYIYEGILFIV